MTWLIEEKKWLVLSEEIVRSLIELGNVEKSRQRRSLALPKRLAQASSLFCLTFGLTTCRSSRRSRSRTECTLRASKRLRPFLRLRSGQDWTNPSVRLRPCFYKHSLSVLWVVFSDASTASEPELFNRP